METPFFGNALDAPQFPYKEYMHSSIIVLKSVDVAREKSKQKEIGHEVCYPPVTCGTWATVVMILVTECFPVTVHVRLLGIYAS